MISVNESIKQVDAKLDDSVVTFTKVEPDQITEIIAPDSPTEWTATVDIPDQIQNASMIPKTMSNLQIEVKDEAGNSSGILNYPFFIQFDFPQDKYVHYKEKLRFIGNASSLVSQVTINDYPVYLDPQNRFSIHTPLSAGKNAVKIDVKTTEDTTLTYYTRILRLVTFPDLDSSVKSRREIEFLATLGILDGDDDGNFYPYRQVTRQYIAKLMVLATSEDTPEAPDSDLFSDVSQTHPFAAYIKLAVESGLIFAYPDGTFKPDQALTLSQSLAPLTLS